jgi:hypothetical protein
MHPTPEINYCKRSELDVQKWDNCINAADNGLVYALSTYLDHMAVNWDALVLGDYDAVMPLTWNKKYGIYYLFQPFLCASLGLFGRNIDQALLEEFLRAVPKRFRYFDIYLNPGNNFNVPGFPFQPRMNHELSLRPSYDDLKAGYRNSYKQLLKRFYLGGNQAEKNISIEEVTELARQQLNPLFNVPEVDYQKFSGLYTHLQSTGKAQTYGVRDKQGSLLASGCFIYHNDRVYYVLAGNHPNGRTLGASHAMLDTFIQDHASQNLTLDFEGSDVSRIAFFFKGFGARELPYPGLRLNRLPRLLRWLKN